MDEMNEKLTTRQIKALPILAGAATHADGCQRAGVSRNTFYKWLHDPAFKAELAKLRDRIVADGMDVLKGNFEKAIGTLVELLKTENEELRRRTATNIIDYVLKVKELNDIEQRLDAIEKEIPTMNKRRSFNS